MLPGGRSWIGRGFLKKINQAYSHKHRFIHKEALACELYGIICVENKMTNKGLEKLCIALNQYKQWGPMKKANKLQLFIDRVDSS